MKSGWARSWRTYLGAIAARTGGHVERLEVEPHRYNVLAYWDAPVVTFSTHIDTVPPFFASREDDEFIWGRGACDTKGIIASMIFAVEALLAAGERRIALLFVVGEERNSAGAFAASRDTRGSKFLINGEPTESKLVLGSKGALRFEVVAQGRMAHSAYPHLGESAIEKLLDALERLRKIPLPSDPILGASTLNIGTIKGGRAPNVIPDHAMAEVFIRLVDDGAATRRAVDEAVAGKAEAKEVLCIPAVHMGTIGGPRDDSSFVYHRHSGIQRVLGHAVFVWAGKHSRRAHRSGAHCEARNNGGDRNVSDHSETVITGVSDE